MADLSDESSQDPVVSDIAPNKFPKMSRVALDRAAPTPPLVSLPDGRRIGPYRIISILGHGGMGVVYRAEQQNPRRIVALKVICNDHAAAQHESRFRHEAAVLGRLQHPGIAQIYEAGAADVDEGLQSFFAMELIHGEPITDYADHRALKLRTRLELFTHVCAAVQYAHEQGVIHRDLKPSNILVDHSGHPKILDFGVARVVDRDNMQQITQHTEPGQLIGTLSYMSPEQAAGAQVDARSDVYALGVILYELLTGRMPYPLKGATLPDAIRMIREDDPTRLTTINQGFGGDVEVIVSKALEKCPEQRYASAAELAGDIRRFLFNEPIQARAPGTIYQLRKFARRNRALVLSTVAVFLALGLGFLGMGWQFIRANAKAHEAEMRLAEGLVTQGNVLIMAQRIEESRQPYIQAWDLFSKLGVSTFPAELGLWDLEDRQQSPLCSIRMPAANNSLCKVQFVNDSIIAYARGRTLALCEVRTGQVLHTLEGHTGNIRDFSISENRKVLVSSGDDHAIKVWDVAGGYCLRAIIDPDSDRSHVAVSANGRVCLASAAGHIKQWNLETGSLIQSFPASNSDQTFMAASPKMYTAITMSKDRLMTLWNTSTGKKIHDLVGSTGVVYDIKYCPDEMRALSYAQDNTIRLWNLADGTQLRVFPQRGQVTCIAIAPRGNHFACGVTDPQSSNSIVRICDLDASKPPQEFSFPGESLSSVCFSADGRLLACAGSDQFLRILQVSQSITAHTLQGHVGPVLCAAVSADGRILVSGGADKTINVWDMPSRQLLRTLTGHTDQVTSIAISVDGQTAASASLDGTVRLWDLGSGKELRTYRGKSSTIESVVFSPDGHVIFFSDEGRIFRGDTAGASMPATLLSGQECISRLGLSNDGAGLFLACARGIMCIDNPMNHAAPRILNKDDASTTIAIAVSPDNQILASGELDGTIRLWQTKSGGLIGTLHGHSAEVPALAFRSDGALVSISNDETLRLWNITERKEIRSVPMGTVGLFSLPVCPDGTTVSLRTDGSGTLDVWDFPAIIYLRQHQAQAQHAYELLAQHPDDGSALASLGEWYAFRRMNDWAVVLLERARRQGTPISALTLARCYWQIGSFDKAVQEFDRAIQAHEGPDSYLRLCRNAVQQHLAEEGTRRARNHPSVDDQSKNKP